MINYETMTQEDFDNILTGILQAEIASNLLLIPGVYELVAEEYNNDVLDLWAKDQESD